MEVITKQDIITFEENYSGWPTQHNDFLVTACFSWIRPSIKPELTDIYLVRHYGPCEETEEVFCVCEMRDGTTIRHDSHPIGECPFCEYREGNDEDEDED